MDITFLIGNGFDIRMGLNTSFKAVCNHYINLKGKTDELKAFQDELRSDIKYWSDFELAMGEYTNMFMPDEQEKYKNCIADFIKEMNSYLRNEEKRIRYSICKEEIQLEFRRSMQEAFEELKARSKNEINSIINQYQESVHYNFISFNYTNVLDECLRIAFEQEPVVGSHVVRTFGYTHDVKTDVIHVHGKLSDSVIMGVDNNEQIRNPSWAKQKRFCESFVKPAINRRAGFLADDDAAALISNSPIVCVFGMSLGETDKTWWKLIGESIKAENRKLIIFAHEGATQKNDGVQFRLFEVENERIDLFLDRAGIKHDERALIEEKITVVPGTKLFNLNLVDLTIKKRINEIK